MADIQPNAQGKVRQAQKRLKKHQAWINQNWETATNAQKSQFQKRLNLTLIHLGMNQINESENIE